MSPYPDHEGAIAHALHRLRDELPAALIYHSPWHTEGDVMPAADRLARDEGVDEAARRLLAVAAAYHDIGYIEKAEGHELIGLRVVAETLPRFGFDPPRIERIQGLILATRLPQRPNDRLEEILADADLDGLGREDFAERSEALRREMAVLGESVAPEEWARRQLEFLRAHRYFTAVARARRDEGRQRNIALLEARCGITR